VRTGEREKADKNKKKRTMVKRRNLTEQGVGSVERGDSRRVASSQEGQHGAGRRVFLSAVANVMELGLRGAKRSVGGQRGRGMASCTASTEHS